MADGADEADEPRATRRARRPRREPRASLGADAGSERRRADEPAETGASDDDDLEPGNAIDRGTALELLRDGELEIVGRLVDASNVTLYGTVACPVGPDRRALKAACVYKPIRGERPLDDFPIGTLAFREVAAHTLSDRAGWGIVPPTVLRDGPLGRGMAQLWIEVDDDVDVVSTILTRDPSLRRMALFDAVVNNADRKGGHMLPVGAGRVYGVDHGVTFAIEPKLRTVLWGWRGERFTDEEVTLLSVLRADLDGELGLALRELLSRREVAATARRVDALLGSGVFPMPHPGRPAIPWPPF
jgi:hypothetical protein